MAQKELIFHFQAISFSNFVYFSRSTLDLAKIPSQKVIKRTSFSLTKSCNLSKSFASEASKSHQTNVSSSDIIVCSPLTSDCKPNWLIVNRAALSWATSEWLFLFKGVKTPSSVLLFPWKVQKEIYFKLSSPQKL